VPTPDSACVSCGTAAKISPERQLSSVGSDGYDEEKDGVEDEIDGDDRLGEWWSNRMEALLVYPD
jgi:hypothetical protein